VTPPTDAVPFAKAEIVPEAQEAALEVLRSGWITMGPRTAEFEQALARYVGARHVIAVASCTAAIEIALRALRLGPGAAVLTPSLTFCGAVAPIVQAGLRPVLVDVDADTFLPTPATVSKAVRRAGRPAAMIVQHMAGHPADVPELAAAAGLPVSAVIEDAAHGLGAELHGTRLGGASRAACFSFYATKNLPIGEGGAITTTDGDLAERWRRMRLHGMSGDAWRRYHRSGTWRYTVEEAGMKANFTDLQAAIGREQLRRLPAWQQRRAAIAARYDAQLAGLEGLELPPRPAADAHAWHLYIVRIHPRPFGIDRDTAAERLAEAGIGTSVHFIPVHHLPYFRNLLGLEACGELSAADQIFPRLLSLPMFPGLTDSDVDRVCEALTGLAA
jgi:perosamine synthetase